MNCPRCGTPISDGNVICDNCGLIFNTNNTDSNPNPGFNENVNKNPNPGFNENKKMNSSYRNSSYANQVTFQELLNENGVTQDEVAAFIGPKNRTYYLRAFNKITSSKNYTMVDFSNQNARNFSAGKILNLVWILYRKMFQECVVGFVIYFAVRLVGAILGRFILIGWIFSLLSSFIAIIIAIVVMVYGDQIYRDSVIRKVKEIKRMYGNTPNYFDILSRAGGTLF